MASFVTSIFNAMHQYVKWEDHLFKLFCSKFSFFSFGHDHCRVPLHKPVRSEVRPLESQQNFRGALTAGSVCVEATAVQVTLSRTGNPHKSPSALCRLSSTLARPAFCCTNRCRSASGQQPVSACMSYWPLIYSVSFSVIIIKVQLMVENGSQKQRSFLADMHARGQTCTR